MTDQLRDQIISAGK